MLQSALSNTLPRRACVRQLFLVGSAHQNRLTGSLYRSYSNGATILSGQIRGRPPTTTQKVSQDRSSAKRSIGARESQSSLPPTKESTTDDDAEARKIRDAVKVAIYGILHRHEDLKTLSALAKINGYQPVRIIDEKHGRVQLAEGVIADAHKRVNEEITLFARPARRGRGESFTAKKDHPSFLEEDFTLYRIMEQGVEEWFDRLENGVREWYRGKIDAAQRAVDRAYTPVSNLIARNRSAGNAIVEGDSDPHVNAKASEMTSSLTTVAGNNEDILVLSKRDGRSLLVEDVPPQYRLLVLPETSSFRPYSLRHGRSGTVIYTGLVLFGAVPLTYRSFNYAMDYAEYPAIANTMIASVVASISYSLWASWASARTRQLLVVRSAVSSRIVAQDDAIKLQLKDEACKILTDKVMNEYFSRLNGKEGSEKENNTNLVETSSNAGLDPVVIAFNLGLLRGKDATHHNLTAVDFPSVSSEITSRFFCAS